MALIQVGVHWEYLSIYLFIYLLTYLFNRSAQAARPGYASLGVHGWTQEVQETMQRYIQGLGKRCWKIAKLMREFFEQVLKSRTKSTQNGPKTKPRGTRNATIVFKTSWEASGGRFSGYGERGGRQLGGQNRTKTAKKQHKKSLNFWSRCWCEKCSKMVPKTSQNRAQDGPKSTSEGSRREKQQKCKNDQLSIVFGTFLVSAGVENPTNFFKKW